LPAYATSEQHAVDSIHRFIREGITPNEVRDCVLQIIDNPSPALRYTVGGQAKWVPRLRAFLPWSMFAASMAKRFGQEDVGR